jgi:hypothetical protein
MNPIAAAVCIATPSSYDDSRELLPVLLPCAES